MAERISDWKSPAWWRQFPILAGLEEDVLAAVARAAQPRSWRAGEVMFQRGDPGRYLLALGEGRVNLSVLSPAGRELMIRQALPGALIGEIACLDNGPRSTDATAASDVRAMVLQRGDLLALQAAHPALQQATIRYLCSLIRDTNDRLESISLYALEARLARFFLLSLRLDPAAEPDRSHADLVMEVSQTDLSLLLGASRPKVNAVLQAFRKEGVVVPQGKVWRCDLAALADLAQGAD